MSWQNQCDSCGGLLPPPPGKELGPPPPAAPRPLPKGFALRTRLTSNMATLIGGAFLLIAFMMGLPMVVQKLWLPALIPAFFALGGFGMVRHGLAHANGILRAFRHGVAEKGKIASIGKDTTQSVNNVHPWKLVYHFPVNGHMHEGKVISFDSTIGKRMPGQPLWVLYLPDQPDLSTLYPPVK